MNRGEKRRAISCSCIIGQLFSLLLFGISAFTLWHFLGKPDLPDIDIVRNNIGDFYNNITDGVNFKDGSSVSENLKNLRDNFGDSLGEIKDNLGDKFNNLVPDDWDMGNFSNVLDKGINDYNFEEFFTDDTDPFVGDNTTDAWPTKGTGGLKLELLNALDENWEIEFNTAINDWDNGEPDALSLTVKRGDVDHLCTQVEGTMKVCNANFGDTGWLGINEILSYEGGFIISSVAKMNEFYLANAKYAKRLFTMCHEIGHGFGLPHTDENFNNVDLGNCMDYTNRPENNMRPDITNYNRLESVYGTVNNRRRSLLRSNSHNNAQSGRNNNATTITSFHNDKVLAKAYSDAINELHQIISNKNKQIILPTSQKKWRLLREHRQGGEYVRRLFSPSSPERRYVLKVRVLYEQ